MQEYKRFIIGQLETNSYIVFSKESKKCFIIDPADISEEMENFIKTERLTPVLIILTHGHMDHCGGAKRFADKYKIEIALHESDNGLLFSPINTELKNTLHLQTPPNPKKHLTDNEVIEDKDLKLEVIHTPGHTPGSVSLLFENTILSGDTLFFGSIGRTDLPGGNFEKIKGSLQRLIAFPESTVILPGHGDFTTIGQEKRINPFL